MLNQAHEWVLSDAASCREDIVRLGLEAAASYQMDLAQARITDGDRRWEGMTYADMLSELTNLQ